jgi:sulfatase maturation enzyme AslB (radical SAM superfamily)
MYQYKDQQLDRLFREILNHDIKLLDLRGGETMMIPAIQQQLLDLDSDKKQKVQLRIQTNGTVLNSSWKEILSSYEKIDLQVSIDATGTDINYIRYPADWDCIQKNLEFFRSLPNVNLTIACTVSNLNLPILTKYLNWADNENFNWFVSTLVTPTIFNPANLPQSILRTATEKIATFHPKNPEKAAMINYLANLAPLDDPQLWQQFCEEISLRDNYRKNSIFDIQPELKEFWIS